MFLQLVVCDHVINISGSDIISVKRVGGPMRMFPLLRNRRIRGPFIGNLNIEGRVR